MGAIGAVTMQVPGAAPRYYPGITWLGAIAPHPKTATQQATERGLFLIHLKLGVGGVEASKSAVSKKVGCKFAWSKDQERSPANPAGQDMCKNLQDGLLILALSGFWFGWGIIWGCDRPLDPMPRQHSSLSVDFCPKTKPGWQRNWLGDGSWESDRQCKTAKWFLF